MPNVGIVIVSHSAKIAEGAADMVRQMVGDAVPLAYTGGNATEDLAPTWPRSWQPSTGHGRAPESLSWSISAGAETNSEMAIELLDHGRRAGVVVCNAPVVEGAVMAATECLGRLTARSREAHSRRALGAMRAP